MSDGKLFAKSKVGELKDELEQAKKRSKPNGRIKVILKKVVANFTLNNQEIVQLFPEITELLKINDFEIRKMCCYYISNFSTSNPKEAFKALPILLEYLNDPSPMLRSFVLRTISGIPVKEFTDAIISPTKNMLNDQDPYVRKTAAFAVAKIFQYDQEKAQEAKLIDRLNELLYDSNQSVVSNALAALSDITERNKSLTLTIDKNHSLTIVDLLPRCNEWSQTYILNALMNYVPQTSEEALEMIERTIPSLQHENTAIVLNAIKVIVYLSNYVKEPQLIIPLLPKRLGSSLVSLLSKPPEIQFLVLRNVILLLLGKKELVHFDVEMFFCKYDDPIYVKDTKLEIIYLLANVDNLLIVLRELEEYATEVDVQMARKAIRAFGNLAVKLDIAADQCVDVLIDLVSNGISYIVQESAIVIKNILRKYPGRYDYAIEALVKHSSLIDEPDSKTAMIWILGQYCYAIKNPEKILEEFVSNFKEDPAEVQLASITSVVKLYLTYPDKGEELVLRILKAATEHCDNPDIRDRGYMYWRLISVQSNPTFEGSAKSVVISQLPIIASDNDNINPVILEELELNIGTLASIYLKPISQVFRLAKSRSLPYSPALQRKSVSGTHSDKNNTSGHLVDIGESKQHSPFMKPNSKRFSTLPSPMNESFGKRSTSSEFKPPDFSRSRTSTSSSTGSTATNFAKKLVRKTSTIGKRVSRYTS